VDTDACELATAVGLPGDPWQDEVLTDGARMDGDAWSAFEVVVIAPRQNGKSYLVVRRALAGALLYGEKLILYSAHEYRTAQETWRLMRDVCESDLIAPHVSKIRTVAGGETIEFRNGARFKPIARTRTSGRGFSPDCLLLDESFALSFEVVAAQMPGVSARPNPQIWYLSSAGTWESEVLLGLRRRGHSGTATSFGYWEWHADATDDFRDPRIWAQANPAYGRRLTHAAVSRELEAMPRRAFLRERLGVWAETSVETVFEEETINALTIESPPPPRDGRAIGWGCDAAWDRTGAAICAAFRDNDGRAVVVLVDARPGAGWLPDRLGELDSTFALSAVAYDARGNITDLMDRAERDHMLTLAPMRFSDYPAACANVSQRVADGSIRFGNAPMLISDLLGATAQPTTNGWIFSRKSLTPPTHLIAATAALWSLEHNDDGAGVGVF
jgi:phage terminase large subunit-like protein